MTYHRIHHGVVGGRQQRDPLIRQRGGIGIARINDNKFGAVFHLLEIVVTVPENRFVRIMSHRITSGVFPIGIECAAAGRAVVYRAWPPWCCRY